MAIERFFTPSLEIKNLSVPIESEKAVADEDAKKNENAKTTETGASEEVTTAENSKTLAEKSSEPEDENPSAENLRINKDEEETTENSLIENESQNQTVSNSAAPPVALANALPDTERETIYSYENNLGSPVGQTEADSSNLAAAIPIKHRAGIANYSFGIPLASLSGRGIDAGINMTYNSRTWNRSVTVDPNNPMQTVNRFTYDVEESWIAPGFSTGFGYLESSAIVRSTHWYSSNFSYYTEIKPQGVIGTDGGRHQFTCVNWVPIYNAHEQRCTAYRTNDGTFIKYSGAQLGG